MSTRAHSSRRWLVAVAASAVAVGGAATWWWVRDVPGALQVAVAEGPQLLAVAAVVAAATLVNLGLRWSRWHFLLRRQTVRLPARDSLRTWTVTLPALLLPFTLGELLRAPLLARRHPRAARAVAPTWLVERLADVAVLTAAMVGAGSPVAAGTLVAVSGLPAALLPRARRRWSEGFLAGCVTALTTLAAWVLPVASLWLVSRSLGGDVGAGEAASAFAFGSLLGGASGAPLGVGVAGSMMITELMSVGMAAASAVLAVAMVRAGTAWLAVGLGVAATLLWRRWIRWMLSGEVDMEHFDRLAPEYARQIPEHVRNELLARKMRPTLRRLRDGGVGEGALGLDLGCGQGWYAEALRDEGYRVVGLDRSAGQVLRAVGKVPAVVGDAPRLPFPRGRFDFVLAVNVLHHVAEDALPTALDEIVRVLRPGGCFLLHEMNTANPVFRWYLGYLFPFVRRIDEGTEHWLHPERLPTHGDARWEREVDYFTFVPDFVPRVLLRWLRPLEAKLESSRFRRLSAHYLACLRRRPA